MFRRFAFVVTCLGASALAQAQATLTMAEQPVRLIRGAAVFKGIDGTAVQKDDILETGAGGVHVEAGKNAIVALGPQTRVYVMSLAGDGKSALELAVLQGWIKLASATPKRALVVTPAMEVTLPSGATIVQRTSGKDALFAEDGAQQVIRIDEKGKPGTPVKLASEQFAAIDPSKPQPVVGRPSREFIAEMPRAFRDRLELAPPVPKAGKVAPVKERDADFADVGDWLAASLPVRKNFVGRFKVRLADPAFRKQLDQALGQSSEWKAVLHPAVPHTPAAPSGSTIY